MSHGPHFGYFATILDFKKRLVAEDDEVKSNHFSEMHSCIIVSLRCEAKLLIKTIFVGEIRANLDETCPVLGATTGRPSSVFEAARRTRDALFDLIHFL